MSIIQDMLCNAGWTRYEGSSVNQFAFRKKERVLFNWLARFIYTSPAVLKLLFHSDKNGLATPFLKRGLIAQRHINRNDCRTIFALTRKGMKYAAEEYRVHFDKFVDVSMVKETFIQHDLWVQETMACLQNHMEVTHFLGGNSLKSLSNIVGLPKAPDLIVRLSDGKVLFVEWERTQKRGKPFLRFWDAIFNMVEDLDDVCVFIVTNDLTLLESYRSNLQTGMVFKRPVYNGFGEIVRATDEFVDTYHQVRIWVSYSQDGNLGPYVDLPVFIDEPLFYDYFTVDGLLDIDD